MNATDLFDRIVALRQTGKPFAVATVVARRAPVSARLGDRAIVFADGRMEGFIGGACSREIIRKQALEAMQAGCGRLVSIRPDANEIAESTAERVVVPMTCASEGAIDVYVEPFLRPRRLIIVGATPVAEALARLARSMDYDVARVVNRSEVHDIEPEAMSRGMSVVPLDGLDTFLKEGSAAGADRAAVVASQGHYDEQALELILKYGLPYVGLVASRKRGQAVQALLKESAGAGVETIRIPAGIDLGARTPSEVALSIIAEIVQSHPGGVPAKAVEAPRAEPSAAPATTSATDPVCGMQVEIATADHTATVDGVAYYFCCAGCRAKFLKDPSPYRTATV
ncbi:MAG TPA: XdhC family protein [Candidatus Dormibacteraeota bacterium]|nr:XdhC family protein [Candidatus Dormibacteraeota bacterium]